MEQPHDLAILFSGGKDSLALYALAMQGSHPEIPRPQAIHLLHMKNGMSRFHSFPQQRYQVAREILKAQSPTGRPEPDTDYIELDSGRLFQGLWLDHYEDLMPRCGGKNLVCVACKLAMHTKGIIYCIRNHVPLILVGYTSKQGYYPEQTQVFMEKLADFSSQFGITTAYPLYEPFSDKHIARHLLEEHGLPSTGGGERKCLFCQTKTTATEKEIGQYLDLMFPRTAAFVEHTLAGRIREAALCFPPGNQQL